MTFHEITDQLPVELWLDFKLDEFKAAWTADNEPTLSAQSYSEPDPDPDPTPCTASVGTGGEDGRHVVASVITGGHWEETGGGATLISAGIEWGNGGLIPTNAFMTFVLDVPPGVTIHKAILTLTGDTAVTFAGQIGWIYGGYGNDPVAPTNRGQAEAFVNYGHVEWFLDNTDPWNGIENDSPDIRCVIQGIVNQATFERGDTLLLFISGEGGFAYVDETGTNELNLWHEPRTFAETGSGGVVCGGGHEQNVIYTVTEIGQGVLGGGEAWAQHGIMIDGGRVVCGGSAEVGLNFSNIATGGAVVSGSHILNFNHWLEGIGRAIVGAPRFVNGHTHRIEITVEAGTVGADLVAFPVMFNEVTDSGLTVTYVTATDTSNNPLPSEFVNYNEASGRLHAVIFMDLYAEADSVAWLFFGD